MRQKSLFITLGAVVVMLCMQALYLISLPGSLVRVYYSEDVDDFNKPPTADMTAVFDGYMFDYRIPFSMSKRDSAEIKEVVGDLTQADMKILIDIAAWVRTRMSFGISGESTINNSSETFHAAANRAGYVGLCDRYAQYFTAACQSVGIPARIIELNGHVLPEAFLRKSGRWSMVDPTLGYYLTGEGVPLSVAEIISAYRSNSQPEAFVFASERGDDSLYSLAEEENLKSIYLNGYTVVSNQQLRLGQILIHIARTRSLPVAKLQYLDTNSIKLGRKENILRSIMAVNAAVLVILGVIITISAWRRHPD